MPVRPIVRLGHPTLRGIAQALPPGRIGEPAIQELVDDMIDTMRAAHGVGLAAPQVGTSLQVFVYEMALPATPRTADMRNAQRHPQRIVIHGTTSGVTIAPMFDPALKIPMASDRSFFGNHSATVLMLAGKIPASPNPNDARAIANPTNEPANA